MKKVNVLIAGSTGYIGLQLVKLLLKQFENIVELAINKREGKGYWRDIASKVAINANDLID